MQKNSDVEQRKRVKMALDEQKIAPGEHLESIKKQPQVTQKGFFFNLVEDSYKDVCLDVERNDPNKNRY